MQNQLSSKTLGFNDFGLLILDGDLFDSISFLSILAVSTMRKGEKTIQRKNNSKQGMFNRNGEVNSTLEKYLGFLLIEQLPPKLNKKANTPLEVGVIGWSKMNYCVNALPPLNSAINMDQHQHGDSSDPCDVQSAEGESFAPRDATKENALTLGTILEDEDVDVQYQEGS
ncbi:hypothetical protein Cgig2_022985 [Carnegiea gigantea]|uniref:Uncharacterized protein n=1 Tax=Carnegiea gigantea TaxID=171969 RepID=A0A9Q1JU86_9CARY|nr:hypothetical protein Cgig2_022985 [Carnegiea gigantea]